MKEYCGNCKHKESCKGARTDINDDFNVYKKGTYAP